MTANNKNHPPPCPVGDPADCPIPHERRADDPWRSHVTARIDALEHRLAENTEVTNENNVLIQEIKTNTDEIIEFFQAGKGFFAVVRAVGGAARWLAIIAAASGIAYGIVKFGIAQLLADMGISKK